MHPQHQSLVLMLPQHISCLNRHLVCFEPKRRGDLHRHLHENSFSVFVVCPKGWRNIRLYIWQIWLIICQPTKEKRHGVQSVMREEWNVHRLTDRGGTGNTAKNCSTVSLSTFSAKVEFMCKCIVFLFRKINKCQNHCQEKMRQIKLQFYSFHLLFT